MTSGIPKRILGEREGWNKRGWKGVGGQSQRGPTYHINICTDYRSEGREARGLEDPPLLTRFASPSKGSRYAQAEDRGRHWKLFQPNPRYHAPTCLSLGSSTFLSRRRVEKSGARVTHTTRESGVGKRVTIALSPAPGLTTTRVDWARLLSLFYPHLIL